MNIVGPEVQGRATTRRRFLKTSLLWSTALVAAAGGVRPVAGADGVPFSFQTLRDRAAGLAAQKYERREPAPDIVAGFDFDTMQKITFRPNRALWENLPDALPVRFFHIHKWAPFPVRMNVLVNGMAHPVTYAKDMFDYGDTGLGEKLPDGLGFAGFRIMNGKQSDADWLAFQGASYFRAAGEENQYGASARGIALNTATETKEEFPAFTEFWLAPAAAGGPDVTVFALLEGPSVTGAYKFTASRQNGATIDVHAELFARNDIRRLGIAPLTSMYWFGENERRHTVDWRPEVHDNDGLALWTGKGERIFRPLVNPPSLQVNTFIDQDPKGFGLMQRDRSFNSYQDDSAFYERRPGIWVEPRGKWGAGSVQLVEIPTDDEIHDNIVAFWQPRDPLAKGETLALDYRLHWRNHQPYPPDNVAQVMATRIGRGGIPGQPRPKNPGFRKFVIDFRGGPLTNMAPRYDLTPVVTLSRGQVLNDYVVRIVDTDIWRAVFDVKFDGGQPLDLRCFLRLGGQTLTETWLYQYFPQEEDGRG